MLDIRIALDYDNLCYTAEYVEHNQLKTICEGQSEASVIKQSKSYVERAGEGRIISVHGIIYEYNGRSWNKTVPVK